MKLLCVVICTLLLSSCATLVQETQRPVQFISPHYVNLSVRSTNNVLYFDGTAPDEVWLPPHDNGNPLSYILDVSNPGYISTQKILNPGISLWFWGNILAGGVILTPLLMWIDKSSGYMWVLPDQVHLDPLAQQNQIEQHDCPTHIESLVTSEQKPKEN